MRRGLASGDIAVSEVIPKISLFDGDMEGRFLY